MTDADIKEIAERVLGSHLSALGLDHIEVGVDRDDPDESILVVEAVMKPGVSSVGGRLVSAIHGELNQILLTAGEERFPYFRVRYHEDDSAAGTSSAMQ